MTRRKSPSDFGDAWYRRTMPPRERGWRARAWGVLAVIMTAAGIASLWILTTL